MNFMHTGRDRLKILAVMGGLLMLFACAPRKAVRPAQPVTLPEVITPEVLAERVDFSGIRTVRAALRVKIRQGNNSRGTFSGVLLYSRPGLLNARLFGPFRLTVMEILFNRGLLQVLIPSKDTLYSGTVAVDTLLPDRNSLDDTVKKMGETDSSYLLYVLKGGELKALYRFSKADLSWRGLELYGEGKRRLGMEIHRTEDRLPTDMTVHVEDASFRIRLKDPTLNRDLSGDYFHPLDAGQRYPLSLFLGNLEIGSGDKKP